MSIISNVIFSTKEKWCGSCLKSQKKRQTIPNEAFKGRGSCKFAGDNLCKLQSLLQQWKSPWLIPKPVRVLVAEHSNSSGRKIRRYHNKFFNHSQLQHSLTLQLDCTQELLCCLLAKWALLHLNRNCLFQEPTGACSWKGKGNLFIFPLRGEKEKRKKKDGIWCN